MNFRIVFSLAIFASASAIPSVVKPGSDISANSVLGNKLLSKARLLGGNNDDAYDFTWALDYSIKFQSCHKTFEFRADGGGSNDNDNPTEIQQLVIFRLCPSDKCGSICRGGEYVVEMREFVEAYMDSKLSAEEYACEQVKENCSCDDDDQVNDDDVCLSQCYANAGLDGCEEDDNNGDDDWEFDVEEYLECEEIADNDDDSNQVYVGAYCSSNGKNIYLGTFTDRQCSEKASEGTYENLKGRALPYASESLVGHDCISCEDTQNDDDGYNNVLEICEELYENSAKCERNLDIDNKVTGGCEYIHKMLPRMEALVSGKPLTSTVLAWVFGFSTLAASGAAYFYFIKSQRRGKIDLSSQDLSSQGDGNLA
eukprot:CAMPEP_0194146076 /NCGR_PEP_ID=MMETSP0152-20130528/19516_1 /TAXON_ID=1049557 /ORGANISM="Thalassiothrix antarctica, Strain L6-D1" /LENGTH=368 /DNA_ID=CAMNT_0038846493 /DNA_START=46 /DNA_END=1152 /DNA_ORIENTATION=+